MAGKPWSAPGASPLGQRRTPRTRGAGGSRMPRMRHGLGDARDADGHERVPALVDLDRRPAKRSEDQGVQKVSRREGRGGTRRSRRGRSRREDALGRGARAAARPRRRGSPRRRATRSPRGEAPKRRLEDPNKRGAPPVGRLLRAHRRGETRARGRPDRGPSRRAASDGDVARGPRIRASRAARGTTRAPSDFRRDPPSRRKSATRRRTRLHRRRREWTRPLAPLRLAARAALPQPPTVQTPDQTRAGSKPSGDDTSLCARIPAARATPPPPTSARARRVPREWTADLGSRLRATLRFPFPALVDSFTQAFRVLQSSAAALIRAHAERGGDAPALGARRRRRGAPTDCSTPTPRLCSRCSTRTRQRRRARSSATRRTVVTARAVRRSRRTRTAPNGTLERNARRRARGPGPGCRSPRARRPPRPPRRRRDASILRRARSNRTRNPPRSRRDSCAGLSARHLLVRPAARSTRGGAAAAAAAATSGLRRRAPPFKRGRSSSAFRGVTLHRRTKRWESHIWVRETGKQLYLGASTLSAPPPRRTTCAR